MSVIQTAFRELSALSPDGDEILKIPLERILLYEPPASLPDAVAKLRYANKLLYMEDHLEIAASLDQTIEYLEAFASA